MEKEYRIPSEAVPYILLQRMNTQKFRELRYMLPYGRSLYNAVYNNFLYQVEAKLREEEIKEDYLTEIYDEFYVIKDYLPETVRSILDVGCGIGAINLFLSSYYDDDTPIFYLFDKTEVSNSVYYQFEEEAAFYNSLDLAEKVLKENSVNERNIYTLDADDFNLSELKEVDLCISLISWAFHYPLETYLDSVLECLAGDGCLLLDFRKETGGFEKATDYFKNYEVISETEKYRRTILRHPITSDINMERRELEPVQT